MGQLSTTSYLIRFDDICPTMHWHLWSKIEAALEAGGVKPILAVVPDNQDPTLQVDAAAPDFWKRVREWQERGWTIALHGYQHLYVAHDAGLVAHRKLSEFASLPAAEQETKLRRGLEIFQREGVRPRVWIAPGNAFDATTVSLLAKLGIRIVSAGWAWRPFVGPHNVTWLPLQLGHFRPAPPGVWTVYYHHNYWSGRTVLQFQEELQIYREAITSVDEVLDYGEIQRSRLWYWFCTSPHLSEIVLRLHLRLWRSLCPEPPPRPQARLRPVAVSLRAN